MHMLLKHFLSRFRRPKGVATRIDPSIEPRLVSFQDGVWTFQAPTFPVIANTLAEMLEAIEAPNYVEMDVHHRTVGPIVVTVQKKRGKTPHQLRRDSEAEAERLRLDVEELTAALQGMIAVSIGTSIQGTPEFDAAVRATD